MAGDDIAKGAVFHDGGVAAAISIPRLWCGGLRHPGEAITRAA